MSQSPELKLSDNEHEQPLVSIIVYNYNYGKYLRDCFESILNQTYENFEIVFSDNASEDKSWEIACDYEKKNPGKIFLARNRKNFGTDANLANCLAAKRGTFYCIMGSDDVLDPEFVATCVRIFKSNQKIMYVMTHRYILDEKGKRLDEAPFYDNSYVLHPPSQNSVYMMAAINPSISQVMYRTGGFTGGVRGIFNGQFYSARIMDFIIALKNPVAYVHKPLLGHRIHGDNQSLVANSNLMEIIGPYVLLHQFIELARPHGYNAVLEKYEDGVKKLSSLSLRYSCRALLCDDITLFERYFYLARALDPKIAKSKTYCILQQFDGSNRNEIKTLIANEKDLEFHRQNSYKPNPPFETISLNY